MAKRPALLAFLCTLGLFVLIGLFLFVDYRRVEQRAEAGYGAAQRATASPAGRAAIGEIRTAAADDAAVAEPATKIVAPAAPVVAESRPARAEPPGDARALNDILKAAANGEWLKVDELLLMSGPASAGSGQKGRVSTLRAQGKLAIDAKEYDKAIEALSASTREEPDDAEGLNQLAYALLREGRVEEAHANVTRSLRLAPWHGATWANAAEILAEKDNALASQAALRVAIHLAQDRDRTLRFLSQADQTVPSGKFRAVIAGVLPEAGKIPSLKKGST